MEEPTEAGAGEGTKVSASAEQVQDVGEDETSVVVLIYFLCRRVFVLQGISSGNKPVFDTRL